MCSAKAASASIRGAALVVGLACSGADGPQNGTEAMDFALEENSSENDAASVAVVDGARISMSAVARYSREHSMVPAAALEDLIALELLAREAARRGLAAQVEVARVRREESVRRFLRLDFENSHTPESIPMEILRQVYKEKLLYFVHPTIRKVHNFVAAEKPAKPDSEAHRRMREFVAEARLLGDPEAILKLAAERKIHVDVNLGTYEGDNHFVKDWTSQTLAQKPIVGSISDPFPTTQFGWHAVLLLEIQPPRNIRFEEAIPELRQKLFADWRKHAFVPWVDALASRHRVTSRPLLLEQASTHADLPF